MTDTVIKGTGNSRTIKAAPATLPATYDEFRAQFISSGILIDLLGLNAAGLSQRGTDLNKASLFSDTAAANFGLGADGTPDQAFRKLIPIVKGSYVGTGENKTVSLTFQTIPDLLIIFETMSPFGGTYPLPWAVFTPKRLTSTDISGGYSAINYPGATSSFNRNAAYAKLDGSTLSFHNTGDSYGFSSANKTYTYLGFG